MGPLPVRSQRHDIAQSSKNIGANKRRFWSIVWVKMGGRIESGNKGVKPGESTRLKGFSSIGAGEHRFDEIRADEMFVT
jgi:hypothetical protein